MSEYIPGTCNINSAEIAYRRKAGYAGLALFIVLFIALLVFIESRLPRIILFIPAFIAAIGFLQAKHSFCVAYGAAGEQNASAGSASASAISDLAAKTKDKLRAKQLNLQAAGIAVAVTLIALAVPTL